MDEPLQRARSLRQNQTDTEQRIWSKLRGRRFAGFKFRRQVPLGHYIVDFVCFDRRVILELDGGQHGEQDAKNYDAERTAWLESQGFRVARIWNHEVWEDDEAVEEFLWQRLHDMVQPNANHPLTPDPSPARGEGSQNSRSWPTAGKGGRNCSQS
jgi:2-methylaconitate isomerase